MKIMLTRFWKPRRRQKTALLRKKAEIDSSVQEWKIREIGKLKSRADAAEVYAAFAVEHAMTAAVEADIATLETVVARIDVEQAVAS